MRLHILSSYDEFIRFYTLPASYSLGTTENNKVLVINNPTLRKFLTSKILPNFDGIQVLEIAPYKLRSKFFPLKYFRIKSQIEDLFSDVFKELDTKNLNVVLYTTFMNGITSLFVKSSNTM